MTDTMNYLRISNRDGKEWILPRSNMAVGLMLYQPSSLTGKWLKAALPYIAHSGIARSALHIEECSCPIDDVTVSYLKGAFTEEHPEFSFFMGTPSRYRKMTVQISRGRKILGYCKLSKKEEIFDLFRKEQDTLAGLAASGFMDIPRCIDCRRLDNGYYAFIQSTCKTVTSTVSHTPDERHFTFVRNLADRTAITLPYRDSDFGKMMGLLRSHTDSFRPAEGAVLKLAVDIVDAYYRGTISFCTCHGDFTPWNTCNEGGRLFVFDWEYSRRSCPPYIDLMHFTGQSAIFEKHLPPEELPKAYSPILKLLNDKVESPQMLYLSYLLFILTLYSTFYDWHWDDNDRCRCVWMAQIRTFTEKYGSDSRHLRI